MRILLVFILFPVIGFTQNPWKDIYTEKSWEQRDTWQKPDSILDLLTLKPNSSVADIGSHEGYFTVKLAQHVPDGMVYGVDISEKRISRLREICRERGLSNVRAILSTPTDPRLSVQSVDAVLIVDTYHEIRDPDKFLMNLKTAMKENARLVICEPIASERIGTRRGEQFKKHELESSFAFGDLRRAGFRILSRTEDFIDRTNEKGDRMWVIVAQKQ